MEHAKEEILDIFEAHTFEWVRYGIGNSMASLIGTHIRGFQEFKNGIYG